MNASQANRIPITSYLEAREIMPEMTKVHYSMYRAPYRKDSKASLRVSHQKNLWIDYGTNEGGTLIDLVLKIYPYLNVSEAIKDIKQTSNSVFSFHQQKTISQKTSKSDESRFGYWNAPDPKHDSIDDSRKSQRHSAVREKIISKSGRDNIYHLPSNTCTDTIQYLKDNMDISNRCRDNTEYILDKASTHNMGISKKQNPIYSRGAINIDKLQEVGQNPIITSYMNQRGIQVATAKSYCMEIYYRVNQKKYFGIAHRNNKGWCIRNKYWKGCTAQAYSYHNNQRNSLLIFEGIFDFLSYLELKTARTVNNDIMILNSLTNLKGTLPILEQYQIIKLYLDHDEAGRRATETTLKQFQAALDASNFYNSHKDLNDYHLTKIKG